MNGDDRARLLHAITTNHIQQLTPGTGCYVFFLNAQGRVLADANILCREDHLLLDTEPEIRERIYAHLDHYIIADDVTLEDTAARTTTLAVEGPRSAEVLARIGAPVPEADYAFVPWGSGGFWPVPYYKEDQNRVLRVNFYRVAAGFHYRPQRQFCEYP